MPYQINDRSSCVLQVRSSSINEETRTVDATISTEHPVRMYNWRTDREYDEVLLADGMETPGQVPLLANHSRWSLDAVIGSARNIRQENGETVATLNYADSENALSAWNLVRGGHLTDVSVGYSVLERTTIRKGESAIIMGREFKAEKRDLSIATKWQLKEVSSVPIGADDKAKIRSLMNYNHGMGGTMPDDPKNGQRGEPSGTTAHQGQENPPAAPVTPSVGAGNENSRAQAQKEERDRIKSIRSAGKGLPDEIIERAIDDGVSPIEARARFFEHLQQQNELQQVRNQRQDPVHATAVDDDSNAKRFERAAMAGLVLRAGFAVDDVNERHAGMPFKHTTMQAIARGYLRSMGLHDPESAEDLRKRSFSNPDFNNLIGGSVEKMLLAAYMEYMPTAMEWCEEVDVSDFKENRMIRVSAISDLKPLGSGGKIEHGSMNSAYETIRLGTDAQMIVLDRQMFINDSLGAFAKIPRSMAMAAQRNIDNKVYDDLVQASGVGPTLNEDGVAMFSASHSFGAADKKKGNVAGDNYLTGASSALSYSSLSLAVQHMRKFKGMAGEPLNVQPVILLVPPELEQTARSLVTAERINTGGASSTNEVPNRNVHQGLARVVVEPRLSEATNGTTAWYLVANPLHAQGYGVAFLNGQRAPTVESIALPPDILGIGWRVYHDVGVGAIDWRGMLRSKGTA